MVIQEPQQHPPHKELEEKSRIYTGTNKGLTHYQQAINTASLELSKQDPSLLLNRGKLFEDSRKKVKEDGYDFVKGKSRAKGCELHHQCCVGFNTDDTDWKCPLCVAEDLM